MEELVRTNFQLFKSCSGENLVYCECFLQYWLNALNISSYHDLQ